MAMQRGNLTRDQINCVNDQMSDDDDDNAGGIQSPTSAQVLHIGPTFLSETINGDEDTVGGIESSSGATQAPHIMMVQAGVSMVNTGIMNDDDGDNDDGDNAGGVESPSVTQVLHIGPAFLSETINGDEDTVGGIQSSSGTTQAHRIMIVQADVSMANTGIMNDDDEHHQKESDDN